MSLLVPTLFYSTAFRRGVSHHHHRGILAQYEKSGQVLDRETAVKIGRAKARLELHNTPVPADLIMEMKEIALRASISPWFVWGYSFHKITNKSPESSTTCTAKSLAYSAPPLPPSLQSAMPLTPMYTTAGYFGQGICPYIDPNEGWLTCLKGLSVATRSSKGLQTEERCYIIWP